MGTRRIPPWEITKPPWEFLPLYPFEDWFGIRALLWVPVVLLVGLAAVPFLDRNRYVSWRRHRVWFGLGVALVVALFGLGIYAWVSPVVHHMA